MYIILYAYTLGPICMYTTKLSYLKLCHATEIDDWVRVATIQKLKVCCKQCSHEPPLGLYVCRPIIYNYIIP